MTNSSGPAYPPQARHGDTTGRSVVAGGDASGRGLKHLKWRAN
jgi:hypothetical protein